MGDYDEVVEMLEDPYCDFNCMGCALAGVLGCCPIDEDLRGGGDEKES